MTIILDTSYLIAYVNGKDVNHKRARQLQEDITKKKYGAVLVPDAVFSEFVTLLRRKARDKRTAVAEGILLLNDRGLTIAGTSTVVFQDAWELFKKYTQVSFVDAVIGAMAKRIGAKHICSFDDDFDALPFVERIH